MEMVENGDDNFQLWAIMINFGARLNADLIEARVKERFGGVPGLVNEWITRFGDSAPTTDAVYYWLRVGKPPGTFLQVMRLTELLDLDPSLLFDTAGPMKASLVDELLRAAVSKVYPTTILSDEFFEIFGPQPWWPNNPKLRDLGLQVWHMQDLQHDGTRQNYYQTLQITPATNNRPQVWYFAYRSPPSENWRVYGSVEASTDGAATLNNFHKSGLRTSDRFRAGPLDVSTHFGPSACGFRVVSMHPFTAQLVDRAEEELRFLT